MCLIIAPGRDGQKALLPRDVFNYSYSRNRDGFGAMWTEDGRVNHFKTLGLTEQETFDMMHEYADKFEDVIFHLRMKTHGKVVPALSHPFRILHKSRHGRDLFFMHNGVLGSFGNNLKYGQSDTTVFKDKILVPLLTRNPDALDDPEIIEALNKLTSGSRLIFLDSTGKTWRTSESSWNSRYGLTLSNTYMLPDEKYVAPVNTYFPADDFDNDDNVYTLGRPPVSGGGNKVYNIIRIIKENGVEKRHWCAAFSDKLIQTESGKIYIDQGPGEMIYHTLHYVPSDQTFRHMTIAEAVADERYPQDTGSAVMDTDVTGVVMPEYIEADEPDPLLWRDPSEDTPPAPPANNKLDEQLRYARLVHNCVGGNVELIGQLMADILAMGEKELASFVKEDAETATTVLTELFEIILTMNDEVNLFDADEMLENGKTANHGTSMKAISAARKSRYLTALAARKAKEEERKVA